MASEKDNAQRPYTYDDLALAARDYAAAKGKYEESLKAVGVEQAKVEARQQDANIAKAEVEKYKSAIRRIRKNMEE